MSLTTSFPLRSAAGMTIFDTVPDVNPNLVWATARPDHATLSTKGLQISCHSNLLETFGGVRQARRESLLPKSGIGKNPRELKESSAPLVGGKGFALKHLFATAPGDRATAGMII